MTAVNSPYTALSTDKTIYVDNSATGAVLQVNLPATPTSGERHTVKWWASQSPAAGSVTVSGNGANIESWANSGGASDATTTTTSITAVGGAIGGSATWEWAATVSGTPVNAWALVT